VTIIPNWHYMPPTTNGHRGLKKLLKYASYREMPDHTPLELSERWTDCGLGSDWKTIYENLTHVKGPYILAHNMVISPAPDLIAHVPSDLRHELVRAVTERTIEQWHIQRGLAVPEYAYCLHTRDTSETRQEQPHTHIFIAGTIENEIGERESHRVEREHVVADRRSLSRPDNLHHIARREFEQALDRTIGLEWRRSREQAVEKPAPERKEPTREIDIDF
jgi:hypothetical protein